MSNHRLELVIVNPISKTEPPKVHSEIVRTRAFFVASLDELTGDLRLEEWSPARLRPVPTPTYEISAPLYRYLPIEPPEVIL